MKAALSAAALLALALYLSGCGGAPRAARAALDGTARVLAQTDIIVAHEYTLAAAEALAEAESLEVYRQAMQPWDGVERGLRAAMVSLLTMEVALDAWDAGDEGEQWLSVVPCAVRAFAHLAELLTIAGVRVPDELAEVIGTLSTLVGGSCVEA